VEFLSCKRDGKNGDKISRTDNPQLSELDNIGQVKIQEKIDS
jgi:hypothetical protein